MGPHGAPGAAGQEQGAPQRYEEMLAEEQAAEKRDDKREILIPPGPRLGDVVIARRTCSKGYGDKLLIDDVDFTLPRGGIVGVIGPNGAGKTTLFRMIIGQEKPDAGELKVGETVALSYVDQSRDASIGERTVWEEISDGGEDLVHGGQARGELARLLRVASTSAAPTSRRRWGTSPAASATGCTSPSSLKSGGNLLLLDEPTNDLDVDTLRALEEALLDFAGCAVVISHDRWFLDRIATHILAFEGDSQVVWFEGNYQDYEADLQAPDGRRGRPAAPDQVPEARALIPDLTPGPSRSDRSSAPRER